MSCKEFEQSIFLYDELSPGEKSLLGAHLQTCPSCKAAFDDVRGTQLLVRGLTNNEIVPRNAALLTSSIMSKIAAEKSYGSEAFIFPFFPHARVALTVLSIFLLVSFAVEFIRGSAQFKATQIFAAGHSAVLSSKIFRDNFSQGKVKQSLFADCGSPLKTGQQYLDCVRSKLK